MVIFGREFRDTGRLDYTDNRGVYTFDFFRTILIGRDIFDDG